MRIAVIGGGWAGLAAAVTAAEGGAEVVLFEAGRVLGGRARSLALATANGTLTLDNGQHLLLGAYRDTLDLMRRVGVDPEAVLLRRPLAVVDDEGFCLRLPSLPAPWPPALATAWGLLSASTVNLPEKLKTALWMRRVQGQGFVVDDGLTVAEWLDAAGQHGRLRRHLWEPLCLAALNTPPGRASARLFAHVLRDSLGSSRRGDTDLLLPRVPFGRLLPEPAANWLRQRGAEIRTGHRVTRLQPRAAGVDIDGEPFTAAILATSAPHAARLCPEVIVPEAWEPIATVYLRYPTGFRLPEPLISLSGRSEGGQKIGPFWAVDRGIGLDPAEQGVVAAVISAHGDWERLEDAALAAAVCAELACLPGVPAGAECLRVIRERRATFSSRPGLRRQGVQTSSPHLFVAGDYCWADYPATLEGAVRSGLAAARRALVAARDIG